MSNTKIPTEELDVFLNLPDVKVVFDVGAREDLDMYQLKPELEYHLFEPVPEYCDILRSKAGDAKNIIINEIAVSDREGEFEYNAARQSFYFEAKGGVKYKTITLDWYCEKFGVTPDFLKIDTEGLDLFVIAGAQKAIEKTKYIQFEYWNGVYDFLPYLRDFDLMLMIEPELRKAIRKFTDDKAFDGTLVRLNNELVKFMYICLIRNGYGGNILCIRK